MCSGAALALAATVMSAPLTVFFAFRHQFGNFLIACFQMSSKDRSTVHFDYCDSDIGSAGVDA